jgi:hypothetical protein
MMILLYYLEEHESIIELEIILLDAVGVSCRNPEFIPETSLLPCGEFQDALKGT